MNPIEFIIKLILTSLLRYLLGYLYINYGKSFSIRLDLLGKYLWEKELRKEIS